MRDFEAFSPEYVKQFFRYEPDTGVIYRIAALSKNHQRNVGRRCDLTSPKQRYQVVSFGSFTLRAHRLAYCLMTGAWPENEIDHINGDPTDNRWTNLRDADRFGNCRNARRKGKFLKGVSIDHKYRHLFRARIRVEGKCVYLGAFPTEQEAHAAYCEAAKKHYGEFARAA